MDIFEVFSDIKLKIYDCKQGKRYFDPIRNKFLAITLEEEVRQKMIQYLLNQLEVPERCIYVEDHLSHYGCEDVNGRIDIAILKDEDLPLAVIECKAPKISVIANQVYTQAVMYANAIKAEYIILVNGIDIIYYKLDENNQYEQIEGILKYSEMYDGKGHKSIKTYDFARLTMEQYEDFSFLEKQEWFQFKIGADTKKNLIPAIMNLDDCLLDCSHRLTGKLTDNLEIIYDLGVKYLNYDDASGGGFGTGEYRLFLLKDLENEKEFITGFSILATGKIVGSEKYGNRDGQSVLIVCRNDGNYDEMSVQINLNKFLSVDYKKAKLTHNAAVTRKGATKQAVMEYIDENVKGLVQNGEIYLGELDISKPLFIDNKDVRLLIGRLILYTIYRDEYKHQLSHQNNKR